MKVIVQIKVPESARNAEDSFWESDWEELNEPSESWQDTEIEPDLVNQQREAYPNDTYRLVAISEE
jgi:hypothetical protein